jgi:hypothetical protein
MQYIKGFLLISTPGVIYVLAERDYALPNVSIIGMRGYFNAMNSNGFAGLLLPPLEFGDGIFDKLKNAGVFHGCVDNRFSAFPIENRGDACLGQDSARGI